MAVPALGRKFWTMTSCTWPWRAWLAAMASRAVTRSARSSPIPTRIPVVNGMPQPAGRLEGGQPAGGRLVRSAPVGGQVVAQGLDHHALAGADRPQLGQLLGEQGAGVGVGQQPGLVEHQPAHGRQIVDGRAVTLGGQPVAGDRVALLRALAQGEQRLVAARPPRPGGRCRSTCSGVRYGASSRAGALAKVQ